MVGRGRKGWAVAVGGALLVPGLGACGGGEGDTATSPPSIATAEANPSPSTAAPAASEPAASEPAAAEPDAAGLPDPCSLIAPEELTALTGTDNGAGKPGPGDPEAQRICIYPSGLLTAVTPGSGFDTYVKVVKADKNAEEVAEATGVGERALVSTYGGGAVTQIAVLDGAYFVTVTGAFDESGATAVAQAMLDAL